MAVPTSPNLCIQKRFCCTPRYGLEEPLGGQSLCNPGPPKQLYSLELKGDPSHVELESLVPGAQASVRWDKPRAIPRVERRTGETEGPSHPPPASLDSTC